MSGLGAVVGSGLGAATGVVFGGGTGTVVGGNGAATGDVLGGVKMVFGGNGAATMTDGGCVGGDVGSTVALGVGLEVGIEVGSGVGSNVVGDNDGFWVGSNVSDCNGSEVYGHFVVGVGDRVGDGLFVVTLNRFGARAAFAISTVTAGLVVVVGGAVDSN